MEVSESKGYQNKFVTPKRKSFVIPATLAPAQIILNNLKSILSPPGSFDDSNYNKEIDNGRVYYESVEDFSHRSGKGYNAYAALDSIRQCALVDKRINSSKILRNNDLLVTQILSKLNGNPTMLSIISKETNLQPKAIVKEILFFSGYSESDVKLCFSEKGDQRPKYKRALHMLLCEEAKKIDNEFLLTSNVEEVALKFRKAVKNMLKYLSINVLEKQQGIKNPTFILEKGFQVHPFTSETISARYMEVNWISCKARFGGASMFLDGDTFEEVRGYCNNYGSGIVLYEYGYTVDIFNKLYYGSNHQVQPVDYSTFLRSYGLIEAG